MTPHAPVSGHGPRHPRTVAGVVFAFLGAIALTIGVTSSPAAGLSTTGLSTTGLSTTGRVAATTADGFTIDLYTVVRTVPGTETSLGSWAVPDELRGRACVATSTPENNPSIHPGNDLRIVSTTTITLVDVEGSGSPVASSDQITLGDQVDVILVMGPDGVYSAGLAISFDCPPPPTTTTTTTTTTTSTAPTTTTSVAPTTTIAVGNNPPTTTSTTTSTTLPCEWDPDLEPDDPDCTTTTVDTVEIAPPTTVGSGSNSPTTVATELPRTGSTNTMLALGALLLMVGCAMVLSTRREHGVI